MLFRSIILYLVYVVIYVDWLKKNVSILVALGGYEGDGAG